MGLEIFNIELKHLFYIVFPSKSWYLIWDFVSFPLLVKPSKFIGSLVAWSSSSSTVKQERFLNPLTWDNVVKKSTIKVFSTSLLIIFDGEVFIIDVEMVMHLPKIICEPLDLEPYINSKTVKHKYVNDKQHKHITNQSFFFTKWSWECFIPSKKTGNQAEWKSKV